MAANRTERFIIPPRRDSGERRCSSAEHGSAESCTFSSKQDEHVRQAVRSYRVPQPEGSFICIPSVAWRARGARVAMRPDALMRQRLPKRILGSANSAQDLGAVTPAVARPNAGCLHAQE